MHSVTEKCEDLISARLHMLQEEVGGAPTPAAIKSCIQKNVLDVDSSSAAAERVTLNELLDCRSGDSDTR